MPLQLNRRNFLSLLAAASALPALYSCTKFFPQPEAEPEPFPGRLLSAVPGKGGGTLYVSNRGLPQKFELPLAKAHSLNFLPDPAEILALEFGGKAGCVVALADGKILHTLSAGDGCVFGGHARLLAKKDRIFFTELDEGDPAKGWLVERDAASFKEIRRVPSRGNFPHGLMLLEDRNLLVVQHIGESSGEESYSAHARFSAHDLKSLRFKENLRFQSDPAELKGGEIIPYGERDDFLKNAAYLMELRKYLNPKAPVMIVEDAPGKRVSLWELPAKKMTQLHSTAPFTPVHSVIASDFSAFLVGTKEGAVFRLDLRNGSWKRLKVEIPCNAHLTFTA